MATQGSPDLQKSTAKQKSTVCITGVNKIAPNFVTLVVTYVYIYMSFGFLKTSQRDICVCVYVCVYIYIYIYIYIYVARCPKG